MRGPRGTESSDQGSSWPRPKLRATINTIHHPADLAAKTVGFISESYCIVGCRVIRGVSYRRAGRGILGEMPRIQRAHALFMAGDDRGALGVCHQSS